MSEEELNRALEDGSISLEDEIDYPDMTEEEYKEVIDRLNKRIEQYENPEDMTLMFMWCDEKAKDEIKRLNSIINELEKDIDKQITFCFNEANGTINDKYCRIAINYLKHLQDKIKELRGDSNGKD